MASATSPLGILLYKISRAVRANRRWPKGITQCCSDYEHIVSRNRKQDIYLVQFLNGRSMHNHHITMIESESQDILLGSLGITRFSTEGSSNLGAKAHRRAAAKRETGYGGTQSLFAIVMVLHNLVRKPLFGENFIHQSCCPHGNPSKEARSVDYKHCLQGDGEEQTDMLPSRFASRSSR